MITPAAKASQTYRALVIARSGTRLIEPTHQYQKCGTNQQTKSAQHELTVTLNLFQGPFCPRIRRFWGAMDAETSSA